MSTNLDAEKTFFDPHPGFSGPIIPIPIMVKKVADGLDGKSMLLREAITRLQAVTNGRVLVKDGWIALELRESDNTIHMFRVIRFK